MFTKIAFSASLILASGIVSADLNSEYKITIGERLADCVQNTIPIVDRIANNNIRSYTKYDKHYVSLNSNSIYVDFEKNDKDLTVMYINNNHIEKNTSAEAAKQILLDIKETLVTPSLKLCLKNLHLKDDAMFSMIFVDPPYENRVLKEVIRMDVSGRFLLP